MQYPIKSHKQAFIGMYRWLSREFTTVECHINESSLGKIGYEETVTTNREIVANHLAYTHLYMFLVAVNTNGKNV